MCRKVIKKESRKDNICDLRLGEKGIISEIELSGSLKTRLIELGFAEGEQVECVLVSPLKDPIAFKVCDLVMALRREDAEHILLKKNSSDEEKTKENVRKNKKGGNDGNESGDNGRIIGKELSETEENSLQNSPEKLL